MVYSPLVIPSTLPKLVTRHVYVVKHRGRLREGTYPDEMRDGMRLAGRRMPGPSRGMI